MVTHLDKQVQEMLTQQIQSRYQGDGILGEEGGDVSSIHEEMFGLLIQLMAPQILLLRKLILPL